MSTQDIPHLSRQLRPGLSTSIDHLLTPILAISAGIAINPPQKNFYWSFYRDTHFPIGS